MPEKKEDEALGATHYITNHGVGSFARGQTVPVAALHKSFGKDRDATPEEHEASRKDNLKRLLDLGAITPTEAPEEPKEADPEARAKAFEDRRRQADEDMAAARKAATEKPAAPSQEPSKAEAEKQAQAQAHQPPPKR